jgi:AbiV family abortive infection protein
MISYKRLSNIAILAFKNGYRLHIDSVKLLMKKSFPSATMLSILAMEEFGKYFSLSTYIFYTRTNETRDAKFEDEYLKELYVHPFKQRACFGRDGFIQSDKLFLHATNRKFDELKQKSIYVGFRRSKGKISYDKPIYNPFKISENIARKQVFFLNKLLIDMAQDQVSGIIEMDEEEVNDMLSVKMIRKLKGFQNSGKSAERQTVSR